MAKVDTKHIAVSRPDGGVTIVCFVTRQHGSKEGPGWENPPTKENIEAVLNKHGWQWKSWRIMGDGEVPTDRTFRNAWKDEDGIKTDMPKARELHREHLRKLRKPLLNDLDAEFMRAVESNDKAKQAEIAAQKQALRDAPAKPEIEAAQTPEELKTVTI